MGIRRGAAALGDRTVRARCASDAGFCLPHPGGIAAGGALRRSQRTRERRPAPTRRDLRRHASRRVPPGGERRRPRDVVDSGIRVAAGVARRPEPGTMMDTGTPSPAPDRTRPAPPDVRTLAFVAVVAGLGAWVIFRAAGVVLTTPMNWYVPVLAGLTIAASRFSIKIPGHPATVSFSEIFVFTSVV